MSHVTIGNSYLVSIAETVKDYQGGDVINPERIHNWIKQFDEAHQETILKEMDQVLVKFYVSRNQAKDYLSSLFDHDRLVMNFRENYKQVNFINIQTRGESQKEILELLDEVLVKKYGVYTEECGKEVSELSTYIYIDDCFFTGNRVHRDIESWVDTAKPNTSLHIVFFGLHEKEFNYQNKNLNRLLKPKNIKFTVWRFKLIEMASYANGKYECCWPTYIAGKPEIDVFIEFLEDQRRQKGWKPYGFFRAAHKPYSETLFSSKTGRDIVEQSFLEKGIEIFNLPDLPNHSMMPMGYNPKNYTLGFGSMFVSYRNVPNNCPLVLWWGDPDKGYPLNQWLPLFPRKTNR